MTQATAQVSRLIHAGPDEVWEALTRPEKLKAFFFGADVDSDFRPGSPITMRGEWGGKPYEDKGEILEARPRERLSFSHFSPATGAPDAPENYHLVTYELAPQGEGATQVTLTQSNLTGGVRPDDEKMRGEYEKNWSAVLEGLERTVGH
jgi:uncharacterized protein YndB with AHSA1/START domain